MEWISVKDRLPEKGQVFCCGPQGGRFVGAYKGGYAVDENGELSCTAWDVLERGAPRKFLYWMPLPEPPAE